jgi:hypothetical protein
MGICTYEKKLIINTSCMRYWPTLNGLKNHGVYLELEHR